MNFADPLTDLVAVNGGKKKVIIYARGLKIYGQIPFLLQRRLQGRFISNHVGFMGGSLIFPTMESNYTYIPWRRPDGRKHSDKAVSALLEWLLSGSGYSWAIANKRHFYDPIDEGPNFASEPPDVWTPGELKKLQELFG